MTVGIDMPRWSGFLPEEQQEAERIQARLQELHAQVSNRLQADEGIDPHQARRCHEVVQRMRAIDMDEYQFGQLVERVRYQALESELMNIVRDSTRADDLLAFIQKRAFAATVATG